MKPATPLRTDGTFGALYQETGSSDERPDIRRVIAAYIQRYNVSYRQAWLAWFAWASRFDDNASHNHS